MTPLEVFEYDKEKSYDYNYAQWKLMSDDERIHSGQKPYTEDMAKQIFHKIHYLKYRK
jgi:hypothetical protein|tara:strand:+ start:315 stop:488 length:174 start_codon:yes stop_codon:yes gene_type:complete